jgi:hypothetical protein
MTETLGLDPVHPRKVARKNSSSTSLLTMNVLVRIGSVRCSVLDREEMKHREATNLIDFRMKVLLFLFLVVHAVSWWPRWLFYEPFYNSLRKQQKGWSQVTAEKFSQAVTAASFHIIMAVFAWRIIRDKPWLWDMDKWSQNLHDKTIEPDFKLYYLLYAARYLSDLVSLFYEHPRSVSSELLVSVSCVLAY